MFSMSDSPHLSTSSPHRSGEPISRFQSAVSYGGDPIWKNLEHPRSSVLELPSFDDPLLLLRTWSIKLQSFGDVCDFHFP
jgi:hypothetical protein